MERQGSNSKNFNVIPHLIKSIRDFNGERK